MHQVGGLMEEWIKSVTPSDNELKAVPEGRKPYGVPVEHVSYLADPATFEKSILTDEIPPPAESTVIKKFGMETPELPKGYRHLQEVLDTIVADQRYSNPLFKHCRMEFTFRQNQLPQMQDREVHIDPPRVEKAVSDEIVYFVSNKQGTITQSHFVKDPENTLNKMTPEAMVENGLMQQSEPFELQKGTQDTYHVQGAAMYEKGRTFVRTLIVHPNAEYFHALPDSDKQELPEAFREKHGIKFSTKQPELAF